MRKIVVFLAVLAALGATAPAAASDSLAVREANMALELWAPLHVKVADGGILVVVTRERQVTSRIYQAIMLSGLCAFVSIGRIELLGVNAVLVVNRFAGQGYVFEGGAPLCRTVMGYDQKSRAIRLLGHTSLP